MSHGEVWECVGPLPAMPQPEQHLGWGCSHITNAIHMGIWQHKATQAQSACT